jgi:hypothetical protein
MPTEKQSLNAAVKVHHAMMHVLNQDLRGYGDAGSDATYETLRDSLLALTDDARTARREAQRRRSKRNRIAHKRMLARLLPKDIYHAGKLNQQSAG